ncbi:spore coat putative kinase YutH [Shouchella clausii]|uniref:spore coat putative kinase YutH n=1 Tax=Shouchella clausii TaxID=79880 RepID=UPI000BA6AFA9|nr:spore coat protein YutH [Shouchella clausii]PAE97596.1 spore coat protein YutH [Shouchella clausii]
MLERNLYDQYKLYCDERFTVGPYEGFRANNQAYIILPKDECMAEEVEMMAFCDFMRQAGDESVLELVPSRVNQSSALIDGVESYVFKVPAFNEFRGVRIQSDWDLGEQLYTWHKRGQQGRQHWKKASFIPWQELWATRLEQLEDWYQVIVNQGPQTTTDEAFLCTYPYFMGMTENAIQFAVDTQLDVKKELHDEPTICHRRFGETSWLYMSERGHIVKPPTAFLYDHPARDLAEWVRENRPLEEPRQNWERIASFCGGYEEWQVLTPYTWQMMYARLIFPLHYFEVIENYYQAQLPHEQREYGKQFQQLLDRETSNADFLGELADEAKLSRYPQMPLLDWLKGQTL